MGRSSAPNSGASCATSSTSSTSPARDGAARRVEARAATKPAAKEQAPLPDALPEPFAKSPEPRPDAPPLPELLPVLEEQIAPPPDQEPEIPAGVVKEPETGPEV